MRKIIFISVMLFLSFTAKSQVLCLSTQCTATHTYVGDTVAIGAIFNAGSAVVSSITFTASSGPNTPTIGPVYNGWYSGAVDTGIVKVSGLIAGTYLIAVVGKDTKGGITAPQYDSIVVAPVPACPTIPGPPTFSGVTITIFGVPIVIPAGQGTKVTFLYNGVIQTVTF
jgi:hypothetical protein